MRTIRTRVSPSTEALQRGSGAGGITSLCTVKAYEFDNTYLGGWVDQPVTFSEAPSSASQNFGSALEWDNAGRILVLEEGLYTISASVAFGAYFDAVGPILAYTWDWGEGTILGTGSTYMDNGPRNVEATVGVASKTVRCYDYSEIELVVKHDLIDANTLAQIDDAFDTESGDRFHTFLQIAKVG